MSDGHLWIRHVSERGDETKTTRVKTPGHLRGTLLRHTIQFTAYT